MSDDPWKDILPPSGLDAVSAKRVDPDLPWNFFWGRSIDRKCLFVLSHSPETAPQGRLPKLQGVEITDVSRGSASDRLLIFKLIEDVHRDIFERLCRDIVASTVRAGTEKEAVALCLARTWRWHHLLRGGADGRLSLEEQKGLAGELLVIERYLLECLSPRDSLDCWRGPLGSPKDFEIGRLSIEVKARRGAATPHVAISSADQLDTAGVDDLILFVVELDKAPADTAQSFTLTDLAQRVRSRLVQDDPSLEQPLERALMAAGFDWQDDYSDTPMVEGASQAFHVRDVFPRLAASQLSSGISHVRYSVALQDCAPFAVDSEFVISSIKATRNV